MNEYIGVIEAAIRSCLLMIAYQLNIDRKSQEIAFISGRIEFVDGYSLDFKEFVERVNGGIEKYKYAYHFRKEDQLVFRYDNAPDPRAKRFDGFPHHQHTESGEIIPSPGMDFSEILDRVQDWILSGWDT